jgi:hypothetical protein
MKLETSRDHLLFPSTKIDGPIEAWGLIEARLPAKSRETSWRGS